MWDTSCKSGHSFLAQNANENPWSETSQTLETSLLALLLCSLKPHRSLRSFSYSTLKLVRLTCGKSTTFWEMLTFELLIHKRVLTGALTEGTFTLRNHYQVSAMDFGLSGLGSNNAGYRLYSTGGYPSLFPTTPTYSLCSLQCNSNNDSDWEGIKHKPKAQIDIKFLCLIRSLVMCTVVPCFRTQNYILTVN